MIDGDLVKSYNVNYKKKNKSMLTTTTTFVHCTTTSNLAICVMK